MRLYPFIPRLLINECSEGPSPHHLVSLIASSIYTCFPTSKRIFHNLKDRPLSVSHTYTLSIYNDNNMCLRASILTPKEQTNHVIYETNTVCRCSVGLSSRSLAMIMLWLIRLQPERQPTLLLGRFLPPFWPIFENSVRLNPLEPRHSPLAFLSFHFHFLFLSFISLCLSTYNASVFHKKKKEKRKPTPLRRQSL